MEENAKRIIFPSDCYYQHFGVNHFKSKLGMLKEKIILKNQNLIKLGRIMVSAATIGHNIDD